MAVANGQVPVIGHKMTVRISKWPSSMMSSSILIVNANFISFFSVVVVGILRAALL